MLSQLGGIFGSEASVELVGSGIFQGPESCLCARLLHKRSWPPTDPQGSAEEPSGLGMQPAERARGSKCCLSNDLMLGICEGNLMVISSLRARLPHRFLSRCLYQSSPNHGGSKEEEGKKVSCLNNKFLCEINKVSKAH